MLNDASIQVNLINFYGKCGVLSVCREIFAGIEANEREKYLTGIRIWNAWIFAGTFRLNKHA